MAVVSIDMLKDQLSFTDDLGTVDDALLTGKAEAAQGHVERMLGYRLEERFDGEGQEPLPLPLVEAVAQLAAWWYLQRETGVVGATANEVPFGVRDIVAEYREWTF